VNQGSSRLGDDGKAVESAVALRAMARQGEVIPEAAALEESQGESRLLKGEKIVMEPGGEDAKVCELFPRRAS